VPVGLAPSDPLLPLVGWAARALTFFNVLVLLWLGLTVLLNAERRQLGTWLAGGGLLLGGLCSIFRASAQALQPFEATGPPDLWWRTSWLPFAGAAYLWAMVLAWYAGRLRGGAQAGEWTGALGLTLLGAGACVLLVTARPPDSLAGEILGARLPGAQVGRAPTIPVPIASMPGDAVLALAAYVIFTALCVLHGLRALYQPLAVHRDRFMGELAARRARPWLAATSLVTLPHSLVVGIGVTGLPVLTPWPLVDLLGALLLAALATLIGQAIVSYEVFTGKTLPRRGLARYWRNALILAAGFGGVLAVSLGLPLDQSYRLTLALVVVAVFYALLSWRSFVERERMLEQLRPFVASEHQFAGLLGQEGVADKSLRAICQGLLGARVGFLVPVGPLASLVGGPTSAPSTATLSASDVLSQLAARTGASRQLCLPIDPKLHDGAAWAVPLWGERGQIGLLLLGEKRDGSLYTQEEIEIARAAGERLLDARAARELARRVLLLQRQRLTDDHLQDARIRRTLHDDVLPLLHTALLAMSTQSVATPAGVVPLPPTTEDATVTGPAPPSAADLLADAHRQIAALLAELPPVLSLDPARGGLVGALRRLAADHATELDGIEWQLQPEAEEALAALSPLAAEVVYGATREAIRNAVRHARAGDPTRPLHLWIRASLHAASDELVVRIQDDGVGLAGSGPVASASAPPSGSGQGLLLHETLVTMLGGTLTVESAPSQGTRVTVRAPRVS
jgi:anti-sigma regulatory factor (Ser/Thr protein kinase)